MRSSASECASCSAPGGSWPSRPSTSSVERCSSQISGASTVKKARTGVETASAVRSGWPSAIPFGTSSPITTCRKVMISSARITASTVAITGSKRCASTRLAEGADRQRGDRDAELHRRDEARRVARDPQHGAGPPVALALELADARPPRRDEAVLGRHEERVQEDQARRGPAARGRGSCAAASPARRRAYWAASSSKRLNRSEPSGVTRYEHMFYTRRDAGRVPRGAVQGRP